MSVNAETEIYVLKIGGSVLTEKGAEKSARASEIERISEEIAAAIREWRESSMRRKLILVHGAGSFGHPQAMKFLKSGEARDAILTHLAVCELNAMFVASLLRKGVSAIPLHPFCIFSASEDFNALNERVARILNANAEKSERASGILVPVLHGDVIFNGDSFQILSGDRIVVHLAAHFNAKKVGVGTDKDGVLDSNGRLIESIRHTEVEKIDSLRGSEHVDVTGGMLEKVRLLADLASKGINSLLFNAKRPLSVLKFLTDERLLGTEVAV